MQIAEQENILDLEEETWASDPNNVDAIIEAALEDFPERKPRNPAEQHVQEAADAITRRSITDKTRKGHLRSDSPSFF